MNLNLSTKKRLKEMQVTQKKLLIITFIDAPHPPKKIIHSIHVSYKIKFHIE